jgi:hypothetical protein
MAKPGFRPDKTLRYYEEIMRGVGDWRRYGSEALREGRAMPARRSGLKTKANAKLEFPNAFERVDAA